MFLIQGVCDIGVHNDEEPDYYYLIGEVSVRCRPFHIQESMGCVVHGEFL